MNYDASNLLGYLCGSSVVKFVIRHFNAVQKCTSSNAVIGISYHIISYHIISYHIISYHIISYHIISYHIISYHIISYHIISYHIISYHIISSLFYVGLQRLVLINTNLDQPT